VVVTEEEIGDEIRQPWCAVARAGVCAGTAAYAIAYSSYLQPAAPPSDAAFQAIMTGAVRVAAFSGFKETITVWRLMPAISSPPQRIVQEGPENFLAQHRAQAASELAVP
jgi:hypothetical protein